MKKKNIDLSIFNNDLSDTHPLPVKPLPVQLKKENKVERSRNAMAKRLHSDLDSDEDLEDNTTKDEG